MMDPLKKPLGKIKLVEINPHLTCYLCKGYYIDATTISECLHSFCRSCIIKFLHQHSYCPICEVLINKAKPNLKLDKTLQDIVYKIVPELFFDEMKARQQFYHNHPELAAKVTPEERGEDTERTIFNPRDTISLSIEYIRDDSTPGALLIPQLGGNGTDHVESKGADLEEGCPIKRFLQCPGMCRVEVLKKFIRNKYNVDTSKYYIDILYKRVPLPDHYTLIDIAYIYSWKRNEPMKFFFKITDINLVSDTFDYLIAPQIKQFQTSEKKKLQKIGSAEASPIKTEDNKETDESSKLHSNLISKEENTAIDKLKKDDKQEYTNITLDRSNNIEIITKIEKVSNRNGLPIGIKITKQTVKKAAGAKATAKLLAEEPKKVEGCKKTEETKRIEELVEAEKAEEEVTKAERRAEKLQSDETRVKKVKVKNEELKNSVGLEIDPEKSKFLQSFELTAKSAIQSPPKDQQKVASPNVESKKSSLAKETGFVNAKKEATPKRKNSSPIKADKAKKQKKSVQNFSVVQMMSNVSQNASKIAEQMSPSSSKVDLQALLFDSYKINIPASLSVTVKNEKDGPTSSPYQKPVQNYIEILKIPEQPQTTEKVLEKLGSSVQVTKSEVKLENVKVEEVKVKQEPEEVKIPKVVLKKSDSGLAKLNPRTPQTFQKMFEEAIKKPEFNSKFQTVTIPKQKNSEGKRNILEIASQLYKKTKMEQEKHSCDVKLNIPRVVQQKKCQNESSNPPLKDFNSYISSKPQQQTLTSLHSPTLGLNYTVSVTQASKTPTNLSKTISPKVTSPLKSLLSPKATPPKSLSKTSTVPQQLPQVKVALPDTPQKNSAPPDAKLRDSKNPSKSLNVVTSSQSENSQPLSPNQLLEKYNIQNLAQLTASFNFPTNLCLNQANQLAAIHQAMIYRHFEMQNHQNWLNMNPGPLMQYEKYLQSLSKS